MKVHKKFLFFLLAASLRCPTARAQCDSTPPLMAPAFTLYGANADDNFGQNMYVIHDTAGHPHLVISIGASGYYLRDYSRYAGQSDTSYRCCLQYTEAHECHVTGSKYVDYVVHKHQAGFEDSIFLIPGSPEGIWSQTRQLLMTPAVHAQIATGDFTGSGRDAIAIGNEDAGTPSHLGTPGSISIWYGSTSLSSIPDTMIWGDTIETHEMGLGATMGSLDLENDHRADLVAASGFGGYDNAVHIFWGGSSFPQSQTSWRDRSEDEGWHFENTSPFGFIDVTRDGIPDLLIDTYMSRDTVWGVVHSTDRIFCYRGGAPFDTVPFMIWRSLEQPATVCLPSNTAFGNAIANVGDVSGTGAADNVVLASTGGFGESAVVILYLGGNKFDTLPDAYYIADIGSIGAGIVGGFDYNNDSLHDWAVPMPHDDAGDHPAGEVAFFAGSRSFRSIGVDAVAERAGPLPSDVALSIAPNPAHNGAVVSLYVDRKHIVDRDTKIFVYDMLGRIAGTASARELLGDGSTRVDLSWLPAGLYSVAVRNHGTIFTKTFIHIP